MPSTVVHVALAWLLAAGLLGAAFDRRSLALVAAIVIFVDLDTVAGLYVEGAHRALFHTLLIPAAGAALLYYDTRVRGESRLLARYGEWGRRVAWTTIACYALAAIGLDLFTHFGANLLYPLHDQFYSFNGEVYLSDEEGFVQSFVEIQRQTPTEGGSPDVQVDAGQRGSTEDVHVSSGVDPSEGKEPKDVERVFPVVFRGWQLSLVVTSLFVVAGRFATTDGGRTE